MTWLAIQYMVKNTENLLIDLMQKGIVVFVNFKQYKEQSTFNVFFLSGGADEAETVFN